MSTPRKVTMHFTTDLGAAVSVETTHDKVLECQRYFGRMGWTSGEVPPGGHQFPLDNEHNFDWALLGARPYTNSDGEACVYYRGNTYKRRELEAVETRKMTLPRAVKYSRGARPTDPEAIREKSDGEIEYVTLVVFRGGRRNDAWALPERTERPRPPQPERTGQARTPHMGGPINESDALGREALDG
jgi:hypothetical protein